METIKLDQNQRETKENKIKILETLIREKLERFMSPVVAGRFGDDHFSFDAASYYTLIEEDNKVIKPIKLGWGEMSKETFLKPKNELIYPETNGLVREIPLPIYCISQQDSYLASEYDVKKMEKDIISFIKEKAIFLFDKNGLGFVGNERINESGIKKQLNLEQLPTVKLDEAISIMKNWEPSQKS